MIISQSRSIIFILFTLSFLPSRSLSQWLPVGGPESATVNGLCVIDSALYAATDQYVFRTTDRGEHWTQLQNGLTDRFILSVNGKGNTIVTVTAEALFRSTDLGATWVKAGKNLPANGLMSLQWIGGDLVLFTLFGVYASNDVGATWALSSSLSAGPVVKTIFGDGGRKFAGLSAGGVMTTYDAGLSWSAADGPIAALSVFCFTMCDSMLFAGTDSGVYMRRRKDGIWLRSDSTLPAAEVRQLLTMNGSIIAGTQTGVRFSTDAGLSWASSKRHGWASNVLSLCSYRGDVVAGSFKRGVHRSTDLGKTWAATEVMVQQMNVSSLCIKDSVIAVGSSDGILLSADEGVHWQELTSDSMDSGDRLVFDNGWLYACGYNGLWRTQAGGEGQWQSVHSGEYVFGFDVHGDSLFIAARSGLFISGNGGLNAVRDTFFANKEVFSVRSLGNDLFVNAAGGIFHSTDRGAHWRKDDPAPSITWYSDIIVLGTDVLIATNDGVFRRKYQDTVWTPSSTGLYGNKNITSFAPAGDHLFAGINGGGIVHSADRGMHWGAVNTIETQGMNVFTMGANSRSVFFGGVRTSVRSSPFNAFGITGIAAPTAAVPDRFALTAYPNPFNPSTNLRCELPQRSRVTMSVYDLLGRCVATVMDEVREAGSTTVQWNASGMPAGVYFVRMQTLERTATCKVLLLK